MAMRLYSRIMESSISTSTTAFTLTGAIFSFLAFSGVTAGDYVPYVIEDNLGNWEEGIGLSNGSTTLNRTFVTANSLGTQANINFPSGDKRVFITADPGSINCMPALFGDGSDGDTTISGTVTFVRDMYHKNLTPTTGAVVQMASFALFVSEVMDCSNAPTLTFRRNGSNGSNSASTSSGTGGTLLTAATLGGSTVGGAGGSGIGSGNAQGGIGTSSTVANGGACGPTGAGGSGNAGANAGGASRVSVAALLPTDVRTPVSPGGLFRAATQISGGVSGGGGSSGGGSSGSAGGGGGGGSGGGTMAFYVRILVRGASTGAGCIECHGGNGGNGGNATVNGGGGGGGSGGGGGWIYFVVQYVFGAVATQFFNVSGGGGGNGGNGLGTGNGGQGGGRGGGGRVTVVDVGRGLMSTSMAPTAAGSVVAASGTTGGTGQTGTLTSTLDF